MLNSNKILLQVCGSIGAFKAVALCSKLVQTGYDVEVVLSEGALQFVGAASFEGFTRKKIHAGHYEAGSMMAHIDLERWADLILLYPTSANTISSLAHGEGKSLIGALFLAHEFKKPYWIAPAMNTAMLNHPALQENLKKLESWGIKILHGESGSLACGEIGAGRLMEPETLFTRIQDFFISKTSTPSKKILVTAGGTSEPIDPVRSITNVSTGETGAVLAQNLAKQGHEVTLLQSKQSSFKPEGLSLRLYQTTKEFEAALKDELQKNNYDCLIHAAAVADFHVEAVQDEDGNTLDSDVKIQSTAPLFLKLAPNPKIIQSVRQWSKNKKMEVISFKLTTDEGQPKLDSYDSEWIVHNELKNVASKFHRGTIYKKDKQTHVEFTHFYTKSELSDQVKSILNLKNQKGLYS